MIVYFLETEYLSHGWNDVFMELVNHMKYTYDAEIHHQKGGHIQIGQFNYKLPDCELFIYDEERDILRVITFADIPINIVEVFQKRNNPNDVLVLSQFSNRFPRNFDRSTLPFKLKNSPWYPAMSITNFDHFYNQRMFLQEDDLIGQMFFHGRPRPDIDTLRKWGYCNPSPGDLTHVDYLSMAIKYKMGIAISGVGEVCYRDFEYLALGIPMLRLEYIMELNPPLVANEHYIAVKRTEELGWSVKSDEYGGEKFAEAYVERYLEVKDDQEFLDKIAKNGRDYYMEYSHPYVRLKHLLNIIEL